MSSEENVEMNFDGMCGDMDSGALTDDLEISCIIVS